MAKLFAYLCSVHIELSVASSKCSCLLSPDLLQFCESSPGKLEDRAQGPTNALSGQLEKFSRKSQLSRRCNSRFSGHIKPTWCLSQYLNVCCKYLMPNWIIHSVAVAHCLATPPPLPPCHAPNSVPFSLLEWVDLNKFEILLSLPVPAFSLFVAHRNSVGCSGSLCSCCIRFYFSASGRGRWAVECGRMDCQAWHWLGMAYFAAHYAAERENCAN